MAPKPTVKLPPDLEDTAYNKNEEFAAAYLGARVETLRGWRKQKKGPAYRKIEGKLVRYSVASLRDFVNAQPLICGGRPAA